MSKPNKEDYDERFHMYVDLTNTEDMFEALEASSEELLTSMAVVPVEKEDYRYEAEKWSIKEVIGHIISAENWFCINASRIIKMHKPDYEYLPPARYDMLEVAKSKSLANILDDFKSNRKATIDFFEGIDPTILDVSESVKDRKFTIRAIAFILSGHCQHHLNVIQERYLASSN